jgi:hypothetical protein
MEMGRQDSDHAGSYENLLRVVIKRHSVRRFEKGKKVDRGGGVSRPQAR